MKLQIMSVIVLILAGLFLIVLSLLWNNGMNAAYNDMNQSVNSTSPNHPGVMVGQMVSAGIGSIAPIVGLILIGLGFLDGLLMFVRMTKSSF